MKSKIDTFKNWKEWDELTNCQKKFFDAFFAERNIFLSGAAGVGKSFCIKLLSRYLDTCNISYAITATTGVAAYNVGGQTIHSWAGIGLGDLDIIDLIEKVSRNKIANNRIVETKVLVIDEVSMLKSDLLDKLDRIFKAIRFSQEPFGGMQVIFVGDFCQLTPVWKNGEEEMFAFESESWKEATPHVILLTEIVRQHGDKKFAKMLNEVRVGDVDNLDLLKSRIDATFDDDGIDPVFLYCKNTDVDILNKEMLKEIPGTIKKYTAKDTGSEFHTDFFNKHTPIPEILELKIGAQVMLLKNIDVTKGLVNGSVGKVKGYTPDGVIVNFRTGEHIITNQVTEIREQRPSKGKMQMTVAASRTQIPLRIAFAITIHKSQGSTIDRAIIDVSSAFAEGMVYVALSRVRNLEALSLTEFRASKIRANKKCLDFYSENSVK